MTAPAADSEPVMPGLVPGIHALETLTKSQAWVAGTIPAMTPGQAPGGAASCGRSLAILHVFRAPVGGLFRHVLDLVSELNDLPLAAKDDQNGGTPFRATGADSRSVSRDPASARG